MANAKHAALRDADMSTTRVSVKTGQTVQGTTYYEPTMLDVSKEFAKHLIASGVADAVVATVAVHATCPHCGFNVNILRDEPENGDGYDNGHNGGRGGYRTGCESCAEPFVIEADTVHDLQHTALRLLGEA